MTAGLLKPSVTDEDVTHTKLRRRQQQQARYYNRGARDLQSLQPGNTVRVEPWRAGRKEWQKGVVKSRIEKKSLRGWADEFVFTYVSPMKRLPKLKMISTS